MTGKKKTRAVLQNDPTRFFEFGVRFSHFATSQFVETSRRLNLEGFFFFFHFRTNRTRPTWP